MKKIVKEIEKGNYSILNKNIFSEGKLEKLAKRIEKKENQQDIVNKMILQIPSMGHNFDWNVGSTLQHFDVDVVIKALQETSNKRDLSGSIGLAWVSGEFGNTNRVITDFLYKIVDSSANSDAWWRAAFSLEKLGLEEAVNLLKMSLKIEASNFEEWRSKRSASITSPRNCNLSWYKKKINVPLQFSSLKESAYVMGYLFGRDAAQYIIKNNKRQWDMSFGITY